MIIIVIGGSRSSIKVVRLPHANMIVDPRYYARTDKCKFSVKGRTLTITRIDGGRGWDEFFLRAYLPTEVIPDFTSTVYTYWGLEHEYAPDDVTKVIFHPSVNIIREYAFQLCHFLVRIRIPDTVTEIEYGVFEGCDSLRYILLPRNLEFIGAYAFRGCTSLEAVFLPPTVTHIGDWAFFDCTSLRFLHVPEAIEDIGIEVFQGCDRLLTTVNYKADEDDDEQNTINNDEVNEWLMQRHAHLHLHQACSSTSITSQRIQERIDTHGIERAIEVDEYQMTALHTLCANPRVTADCIRTYLQLAPGAAEQEDSYGMTPFQYLCRNDVVFFLEEDRDFSSLMAWWYSCMP